jgi:hypothetical protein
MPLSDDASAPGGVALSRMIHATWWTSGSSRAASLGHDAIHGLPNECVQMTRGETSGRPYRMGTWETAGQRPLRTKSGGSRHECGSLLGIWSSFVWEDVVDGSEGDHDQGEGGAGGVEAISPVDDQADAPIESFVAGVVDA